jgi:hypothetical protein
VDMKAAKVRKDAVWPLCCRKESSSERSELAADQIFHNVGARAAIPLMPGPSTKFHT